MKNFTGVKINQVNYPLPDGKMGRIAVFMYSGQGDPNRILDQAVREYMGNKGYHELVDSHLDNPWMRVVMSNINDIEQHDFDPVNDGIEKEIRHGQGSNI